MPAPKVIVIDEFENLPTLEDRRLFACHDSRTGTPDCVEQLSSLCRSGRYTTITTGARRSPSSGTW